VARATALWGRLWFPDNYDLAYALPAARWGAHDLELLTSKALRAGSLEPQPCREGTPRLGLRLDSVLEGANIPVQGGKDGSDDVLHVAELMEKILDTGLLGLQCFFNQLLDERG